MVSSFFIGTSLEIVSCLQWAIISQWISSHHFFMPLHEIYPAPLSSQSAYLQYATIIRRVRPLEKGLLAGIISHGLLCRCSELCLFEALHPAPLARPFSKGLLEGIIPHRLSCRCDELCLFEALYPAPLARPFSKGLLAGDYLT